MFKIKKILFLIAETPVHPGSGSEVGIVDLPIQRERWTGFPKIESSGLKGCLREAFTHQDKEFEINGHKIRPFDKITYTENGITRESDYISLVFGPISEVAHAGAFTITDARILLFPVKSLKGVFAWITCPMVLERFKKDLEMADINHEFKDINFSELKNTISYDDEISISGKVVLEEYTFEVRSDENTKKLARWLAKELFSDEGLEFWRKKIEKSLIILSDDDFTQFVKTSTEVTTRIKIDDTTGTVKPGALWTEEYLPENTVMYSVVMFSSLRVEKDEQKGVFKADSPDKEAEHVASFFTKGLPKILQIGGNQTIGKGFMRTKFLESQIIQT